MASPRRAWEWPLLGLVAAAAALHAWWFKELQDFGVFYKAGARAAQAAPLYLLSDGIECFKYSPVVALLFSPLSWLPFKAAALGWMLLTAGCLVVFFRWSAREYGPANLHPAWHALAFIWLIPYLRYLLALGQSDVLVLALLLASESRARKNPLLSGALWGICVLFKLPFLILLPLALLFREWKRIGGMAAAVAVGLLVPALIYGFAGNLHQLGEWRALLAATTPEMICHTDNQSVYGMICRYVTAPGAAVFMPVTWSLGALCFAAAAYVVWKRRDRQLGFALALYLAALLSPLGWRSNLVALLPLIYLLAARWPFATRAVKVTAAAALTLNVFVGLLVYDVVSKDAFRWLLDHKAIGLLALLFVASVLVHEWKAKKEVAAAAA